MSVILNVDDTDASRYSKSRILRRAGYEVIEAATVAQTFKSLGERQPDLILLDVHLPDGNGIDVCRRIKADPATRGIPVIQISATFVEGHDRAEGLEGGAEIYLTEPLEPKELETVVSVLLRLHQTELQREEAFQRERAARLEAEQATRLKDEFLANLSHELRTPMNIIIGWTHLLKIGAIGDAQKERALDAITRAARSQAQLIEDLLDVSRIVTGKFRLTLRPVDLGSIIEAAIDSMKLAAQSRQIVFHAPAKFASVRVLGDPERLQQAIWNLLSNAVKFTPANGSVELRLETDGERGRVSIIDSGVGITPEFLPFVFDRFRQADGTSTREYMGMGLGLAIVRHVIELHGGEVGAASEGRNRGSQFWISLPVLRDERPAAGV